MNCSQCGTHLPHEANFCQKCGTAKGGPTTFPALCMNCRTPLTPGTGFCAVCGFPAGVLPPAPQQNQQMALARGLQSSGEMGMLPPSQGGTGRGQIHQYPIGAYPQPYVYHMPMNAVRMVQRSPYPNVQQQQFLGFQYGHPMGLNQQAAYQDQQYYNVQQPYPGPQYYPQQDQQSYPGFQDVGANNNRSSLIIQEVVDEDDTKEIENAEDRSKSMDPLTAASNTETAEAGKNKNQTPQGSNAASCKEKVQETQDSLNKNGKVEITDQSSTSQCLQTQVDVQMKEFPESEPAKDKHDKPKTRSEKEMNSSKNHPPSPNESCKRKNSPNESTPAISPEVKSKRVRGDSEKNTDVYGVIPDAAAPTTCRNVHQTDMESRSESDGGEGPQVVGDDGSPGKIQDDLHELASSMEERLDIKGKGPRRTEGGNKENLTDKSSSDDTHSCQEHDQMERVFGEVPDENNKVSSAGTNLFTSKAGITIKSDTSADQRSTEQSKIVQQQNTSKSTAFWQDKVNPDGAVKNDQCNSESSSDTNETSIGMQLDSPETTMESLEMTGIREDKKIDNKSTTKNPLQDAVSVTTHQSSNSESQLNTNGENISKSKRKTSGNNLPDANKVSGGSKSTESDQNEPTEYRKSEKPEDYVPGTRRKTRVRTKDANAQHQQQKKIQVEFYVVIPSQFNYDPKKGGACIQFGTELLGGWTSSEWQMSAKRNLENQSYLLHGKVLMPFHLLTQGSIEYKYCLRKRGNMTYEYVIRHGKHDGLTNRTLKIPPEDRVQAGEKEEWIQYDGIMIPPKEKEGYWKQFKNFIKGQDSFKSHAENEIKQSILEVLPVLTSALQDNMDITGQATLEKIHQVLHCVELQHDKDWVKSIVKSYLEQYLEELEAGKWSSEKRLVLAVMVSHVLMTYMPFVPSANYLDLLCDSLLLEPDDQRGICLGWHQIQRHFPQMTSELLVSLKTMVGCCVPAYSWSSPRQVQSKWIFLMPLIHFLDGSSIPYQNLPLSSDHRAASGEWWGVQEVTRYIEYYKQWSSSGKNFEIGVLMPALQKRFEMDKMLERTVAGCVNDYEVPLLMKTHTFSPDVILGLAFYHISKALGNYPKNVELIKKILGETVQKVKCNLHYGRKGLLEHESEQRRMIHIHTTALSICKEVLYLVSKMHHTNYYYDIVTGMCSLFRECVVNVQNVIRHCDPSFERESGTCYEDVRDVANLISSWYKSTLRGYIAYGPRFINLNEPREFEIWSEFLSIKFVDEAATSLWQEPFVDILERRIDALSDELKVELMCSNHLNIGKNATVEELVSKSAFKAVEKLYQSMKGEEKFLFHPREERKAENVGRLMSHGFINSWPKDQSSQHVLRHMLQWPSFPLYVKTFCDDQENVKYLHDKVQYLIGEGLSCLHKITKEVLDGSIQVEELYVILQHTSQFTNLAKLRNSPEVVFSDKQLENLMKWREQELQEYNMTKRLLLNLVQQCDALQPVNCTDLKDRLKQEIGDRKLNEIVQPLLLENVDSTMEIQIPKLVFFQGVVSPKVKEILKPLMKIQGSNVFIQLWNTIGRQIRKKMGKENVLNLDQVASDVWRPAYSKVQDIYKRLASGDMPLREVQELFNDIGPDPEQIKREMRILSGGENTGWIDERFEQMTRYYRLKEFYLGAKAVLKAAKALELRGNFETLSSILDTDDAKPLKSITEEMMQVGENVKHIDQEKTASIETIVQCGPLVEWLKTNVKNMKELKVLVDLAMISASGQGDIEVEKVSCLHSAVTGYASLIYELNEKDGFEEFLAKCQPVWKAIESDQSLPKNLTELNRQLRWLKGIKESHGAVEVSALAQAKAINARGIYRMGAWKKDKSFEKVEDVIRLILPPDDKQDAQDVRRSYSLQQLNDLQSKLMLVAGKAEKGKDEVDRFVEILDGITRLASTYIKLCQAGSVLFQDCDVKFSCDPKKKPHTIVNFPMAKGMLSSTSDTEIDVNQQIHSLSKFMEDCLQKWLQYVNTNRDAFDQLNHFTTEQLVILRREIVKLCGEAKSEPSARIYPLLHQVRRKCSAKDLIDALHKADRELALKATEVEMDMTDDDQVNENDDTEQRIKGFLSVLMDAGNDERVAKAALKALGPDDVDEALIWCLEHEEEVLGGGDAAATFTDNSDQESTEEDSGPVGFVSEATMTDTTQKLIQKFRHRDSPLKAQLEKLWKEFLESADQSVADYLSVEHLGIILKHLGYKEGERRPILAYITPGKPNLVVCPQADLLKMVLTLYMQGSHQPLPSANEVLLCDHNTTAEQIELLWRRMVSDTTGGLYCLAHVGLLDYDVSEKAEQSLDRHTHGKKDFQLVVLCSTETEDQSRLVTALDSCRVANTIPMPRKDITQYLQNHFTVQQTRERIVPAATLDPQRCNVRVIQSRRAGVGKTLRKSRYTRGIRQIVHADAGNGSISIPLQDKKVDESHVLTELLKNIVAPGEQKPCLFHIDIAHEVHNGVDHLLFNLLVLGSLTDKTGYVWQKSAQDLYIIETMPLLCRVGQERGKQECQSVHHLLPLLPTITCRSPVESRDCLQNREQNPTYIPQGWDALDQIMDEDEFQSQKFQRVYQYLSRLADNRDFSDVNPLKPEGTPLHCLNILLRYCGIRDPSWAELRHFVSFLNIQLHDCELSAYCGLAAADILPGFLTFVVKFMIQMSTDFATRSLQISEETPGLEYVEEEDETDDDQAQLERFQMRRTWESSPHPYIFFNPDHSTFTFIGFYIDRKTRNLLDQETNRVLEREIMTHDLQHGLYSNGVPLEEKFDNLPRDEKICKLCQVFGNNLPHEPDETYELTTDNVKKILAIHMRFRCGIPVIVMGETGCGKTRLVKFMCDLQVPAGADVENMVLMKVHGGTNKADIQKKVNKAIELAQENQRKVPGIHTVLFFDEANTTEAIEMMKEILCDYTMAGNALHGIGGLKFIAACNPYRKHSDEMIRRLEQAGLGYHTQADQTTDKLGRIPMRQLVYRVHALPQSLLPLVWDFGQLNADVERLYIKQIVNRYINSGDLEVPDGDEDAWNETITRVLGASQQFMRKQTDECSFVSLRDVERVMNVMVWFSRQEQLFAMMDEKALKDLEEDAREFADLKEEEEILTTYDGTDDLTRSLILALGVCYHARLSNRKDYRKAVARHFVPPADLKGGADVIENEIIRCQDIFLDEVQLEANIAKNQALKENVFMMIVCIELRIPLFLVGKPGSSKSLAKTIVADAMQGKQAPSDLFKSLKQVHMVSFQCSPLSTPNGIVGTFHQCARLQKDKNLDEFVSVVVLDEVGLAEDSPRMPLKTLHPLLEDGCEGDEDPELYKKVAFIGISNWALDPAKMNRGIMVQRGIPDEEELINSARGICSTKRQVLQRIKPFVKPMAEAYLSLYNSALEIREFFGLRDFYSLVKMVYGFSKKSKNIPTWKEMKHAILRNFGGLDGVEPLDVFVDKLGGSINMNEPAKEEDPDCSAAGLIKACLHGDGLSSESRYLLILTENYAALPILQQHLQSVNDAIIIFGSSFPKDQEYTQVCRNINRVKVCMETGKTVVLLNLENLYESLYDALNQYYSYFADQRFVDLGLGTHRVKCRVHKDFRLIVVAEKQDVYRKFPIPLINRLEKHFLATTNMLTDVQISIAEELDQWAKNFATLHRVTSQGKQRLEPKVGDVFIGFHADAAASVTLHVCTAKGRPTEMNDPKWVFEVLTECKKVLLQCATPDALVRLPNTKLMHEEKQLVLEYFQVQKHGSLQEYLVHKLVDTRPLDTVFLQVTTHSRLLSGSDVANLAESLHYNPGLVALHTLQAFDTEQQFCKCVQEYFNRPTKGHTERLLILQCDSGHSNADLVACARHILWDEYKQSQDAENENIPINAHVVFLIQLPRIAGGCFVGFQGGKWESVHIDELRPQNLKLPSLNTIRNKTVGQLFEASVQSKETNKEKQPDTTGTMQDVDSEDEVMVLDENTEAHPLHDNILVDAAQTPQNRVVEVPCGVPLEYEEEPMDTSEVMEGEHAELMDIDATELLDVDELLRNCVQGAAAMLKDRVTTERTTHRVQMLLLLLDKKCGPKCIIEPVKKRVAGLLKDKEATTMGPLAQNWSHDAASLESVNRAGTLTRSLWTYLIGKATTLLAGLVAYTDTNCNIDIIHEDNPEWIHSLWLDMLNDSEVTPLRYSDLPGVKQRTDLAEVPVQNSGYDNNHMKGVLPFSWLIKEKIDEILTQASTTDEGPLKTEMKRAKVFNDSPVGRLLSITKRTGAGDQLVDMYVKDFVQMVYKVHYKTAGMEYELVERAIRVRWTELCAAHRASEDADQMKELPGLSLTAVHIAFSRIQQRLNDMSVFSRTWPECVEKIHDFLNEEKEHPLNTNDEMTLDVIAVKLALEDLTPGRDVLNKSEGRKEWLKKVDAYQIIIERILSSREEHQLQVEPVYGYACQRELKELRPLWNCITVMKLFIQHMCPPGETEQLANTYRHISPLWKLLEGKGNFKKKASMEAVEKFLKGCYRVAKGVFFGVKKCPVCEENTQEPVTLKCKHVACLNCLQYIWDEEEERNCPVCKESVAKGFKLKSSATKKNVDAHNLYKKRCNAFFMDLVSQLCFAGGIPPEADLVDLLMQYVTRQRGKKEVVNKDERGRVIQTKRLSLFDDHIDDSPVVRSLVIQLLLRSNLDDAVREHIQDYFDHSREYFDDTDENIIELATLFVQCLEDSYQTMSSHGNINAVKVMCTIHLRQARQELFEEGLDVEKLEAVAKTRFGLGIAADWMFGLHAAEPSWAVNNVETLKNLFRAAEAVCDQNVVQWPRIYLLKQIVRNHGLDALKKIIEVRNLSWVLPEHMRQADEPDRLLVLGGTYKKIRDALSEVYLEGATGNLIKAIKGACDNKNEVKSGQRDLLMALFKEVTRKIGSDRQPPPDILQQIGTLLQKKQNLGAEQKVIAEAMLTNRLGRACRQLTANGGTAVNTTLQEVLVHYSVVLRCADNTSVIQPFWQMIHQTNQMQAAYLPTMPQDELMEVREALLGARGNNRNDANPFMWECPNGHPYVIGDCGRPAVLYHCITCGVAIGGQNHTPAQGNRHARKHDITQNGHILGDATQLNDTALPERELSASETALVRFLLHAAMFLAANENPQVVQPIIKSPANLQTDQVPDFLWNHILRDLKMIQRALGRSPDDVITLLHIIISALLTNQRKLRVDGGLQDKKKRMEWESSFAKQFLRPILQSLPTHLQEANNAVANDDKLGDSLLMRLVYETTSAAQEIKLEHTENALQLWRYRKAIDLASVREHLGQGSEGNKYELLQLFMKKVPHLELLKLLPNIMRIIRHLVSKFHHRLDRAQAQTQTVGEYIASLPKGPQKKELADCLDDYFSAWHNIKMFLPQFGFLGTSLPQDLCEKEMGEGTCIATFLPSLKGHGACTVALVHYLVMIQNTFLDEVGRIQKLTHETVTSVDEISHPQLVSFSVAEDIITLVIAHCNYSLEVGKGTIIEYDFVGLQRQIYEKFIRGRPMLVTKLESSVYQQEITNAAVLSKLQQKIEQVPLSGTVSKQIEVECRDFVQLAESLANLEIAIGFLQSVGGKPDSSLTDFMTDTLSMKEPVLYSPKARQTCKLKHAQNLWLVLSHEKSKIHHRHRQDPFENIGDEYYTKITKEDLEKLKTFLTQTNVELFLGELFECIVLQLTTKMDRNADDYVDYSETRLGDILHAYLEGTDHHTILPGLTDGTFPAELLGKHSVECWKISHRFLMNQIRA